MKIGLCENRESWNGAVRALDGTLYHSWGWGETRANQGWRPWRVLAQQDGNPRAALQIFERKTPFVRASLLYAACGVAGNDLDPETVNALAVWAQEFSRDRKAILLRIEACFDNSDEERTRVLLSNGFKHLPDQWSLWNLPRATMVIDIRGSEEELLRRMRKKHREHIHRAQRNGLSIVTTDETPELRSFYTLLLKSSERQGFAVRDFSYFLDLRERLIDGDRGSLFLAKMNGRPVAGILCSQFGSTCHYLYGGFDWSARRVYANEALHWTAIQWARKSGCTQYDMVGAGTPYPPAEGNTGYGLYNFKKGFGAEMIYSAGYFDLPIRPALYSLLRLAETHTGWMKGARTARSAVQQLFDRSRHSYDSPPQASPVLQGNTARNFESTEAAERR